MSRKLFLLRKTLSAKGLYVLTFRQAEERCEEYAGRDKYTVSTVTEFEANIGIRICLMQHNDKSPCVIANSIFCNKNSKYESSYQMNFEHRKVLLEKPDRLHLVRPWKNLMQLEMRF